MISDHRVFVDQLDLGLAVLRRELEATFAELNRSLHIPVEGRIVLRETVVLVIRFLLPVSFTMHNFWAIQDPMHKMGEMVNFTKNMALIGCALMFLAIPQPWPYSVGY
jgi:hypothetical protein